MATLKINIKQHVTIQQTTGTAGYYSGLNPQSLTFVAGTLPQARQWPNYGKYTDVTTYISDAQNISLKWSEDNDEFGNTISEDGKGQKQSSSGSIIFESYAFELIKKWLIDDISAKFNSIDVMIEDVECGRYLNWQIKAKDIVYCEDANCSFDISISQADDPLTCIQRTLINDNWQGWFQQEPSNNKKHPRFSYCNEIKPNGLLVVQMATFGILAFVLQIVVLVVGTIYNVIAGIILVIKKILSFIGLGGIIPDLEFFSYTSFFNAIGVYYTEMMGCGREHPAPLIQDYISNVCSRCGVSVNANTAPLFYADTLTLETSDPNRGQITVANPHVRACYLFADRKRGIRRFENVNIFTGYVGANTKDWYLEENKPDIFLDTFLDKLSVVYNLEWQLKYVNNSGINTPTLFIYRKDNFRDPSSGYLYDVSPTGPDRPKVIEGICYEQNGTQTAAMLKGIYQPDAADTCGNEALQYMNDTVVFGNIDNNPNLIGEKLRNAEFGATRFRLDGASNDYAFDALQTTLNILGYISLSVLTALMKPIFDAVINNLELYGNYALLMKDDVTTLPKILIWDGNGYNNAKAIRQYYATANNGAQPQINPAYNGDLHAWDIRHRTRDNTFVLGGNGNAGISPYGTYSVSDVFALFINKSYPAMLPNYNMYFAQDFYDTLWDWFHFIDDPNRNVILDRDFTFKIENCCDDLKRLKVFDAAGEIKLGAKIKLGDNSDGVLREINVSYKTNDRMGQFIELKGKC